MFTHKPQNGMVTPLSTASRDQYGGGRLWRKDGGALPYIYIYIYTHICIKTFAFLFVLWICSSKRDAPRLDEKTSKINKKKERVFIQTYIQGGSFPFGGSVCRFGKLGEFAITIVFVWKEKTASQFSTQNYKDLFVRQPEDLGKQLENRDWSGEGICIKLSPAPKGRRHRYDIVTRRRHDIAAHEIWSHSTI